MQGEPGELDKTELRLNTINHLKSKYGKTIQLILDYYSELESKIEHYLNYDFYLQKLEETMTEKEKELQLLCEQLHNFIVAYAVRLSE